MGVNFCRFDAGMAEQVLNGTNVNAFANISNKVFLTLCAGYEKLGSRRSLYAEHLFGLVGRAAEAVG